MFLKDVEYFLKLWFYIYTVSLNTLHYARRWRPAGWKYNSVSEEWLQKGYSRLMRKTLIDPHNEIDEEGPK